MKFYVYHVHDVVNVVLELTYIFCYDHGVVNVVSAGIKI